MTGDGEDFPGLQEMIRSIEQNKTLLSLNLGNNKLEPPIGKEIRKMLQTNHTLIDLEIGFNSFDIKDVSVIFFIIFYDMNRYARFKNASYATRNSTIKKDSRSGVSVS